MGWGVLEDKYLDCLDVPGTVQLLDVNASGKEKPQSSDQSEESSREEPQLGEQQSQQDQEQQHQQQQQPEQDGHLQKNDQGIILIPQPLENDPNDPLNWPRWRRDLTLAVIGFHAFIGGGQTPMLSAGFSIIATQFNVSLSSVSITTGAYMLALGIGSVVASPTALVWGKRPVYLAGQILFIASCIWGGLASSYGNLLGARILEGIGVSPCECLPSSSIAEIFYLHERPFRIGVYSMLLLGGKNLIPLISAAIIQTIGWRWVFFVMAITVSFNFIMTYFCVTETVWDRHPKKPRSAAPSRSVSMSQIRSPSRVISISQMRSPSRAVSSSHLRDQEDDSISPVTSTPIKTTPRRPPPLDMSTPIHAALSPTASHLSPALTPQRVQFLSATSPTSRETSSVATVPNTPVRPTPMLSRRSSISSLRHERQSYLFEIAARDVELADDTADTSINVVRFRQKSYRQQLVIFPGRYLKEAWWKIALRPFVLYTYPAILFATLLYSVSVVWLIFLSEVLSQIFSAPPYDFNAILVGLLYCAPFIGGVISGSIAGKISDIVTRALTKRNGGVYEPEFRLVMVIPVALATAFGLYGFGWSSGQGDPWIAPAVFFGFVGFGCTLGSTVSISYTVDCHRAFAGEALVTLNLSKNVLGFACSLFSNRAIDARGVRNTFLILGSAQIFLCIFAIPLFRYGKRARSWSYRKDWIRFLY